MKAFSWKTSSDFSLLIDTIRNSSENIIVSINQHAFVSKYHVHILRQLFPESSITFITRDNRVKKIVKQFGYPVFSSLQDMHHEVPDEYQIIQENLSIPDYIRFHIIRSLSRFFSLTKKFQPKSDIFTVKHSSWYILVIGIITILLLMIGIVSLTTPHAVVTITPQINIQNAIHNFTFVEEENSTGAPFEIPVRRDILSTKLEKTYNVNTYDPASLQLARGVITIKNYSNQTLNIKPQSRVLSGVLLFRTEDWVTIEPANGSEPSETTVRVVSEANATDGSFMGERGNVLKDTVFSFPGLSEEYSEGLVMVAREDFFGGKDAFKRILTQEEYDRLEKIFREQFTQSARTNVLARYVNDKEYTPLPIPEAIHMLDISFDLGGVKVGDSVDTITFSGEADFMVHLYQISTLRTLLLQSASTHLLENTESLLELRKSAPPDIISVLSSQDDPWSIKATAQIPVQILYDFSSSIGQISIQNILFDLLNADIDRAEKTLLNHPYIKSVDIRVTPFWANRLPGDMDKIYIKVNNL